MSIDIYVAMAYKDERGNIVACSEEQQRNTFIHEQTHYRASKTHIQRVLARIEGYKLPADPKAREDLQQYFESKLTDWLRRRLQLEHRRQVLHLDHLDEIQVGGTETYKEILEDLIERRQRNDVTDQEARMIPRNIEAADQLIKALNDQVESMTKELNDIFNNAPM
jgi:O6-methylguanine-DNA--protein-cysteine methyltransferase